MHHFLEMVLGDMGVNFRGRDIGMPQKRLHRAQIRAALHKMRGEGMAQHMRRDLGRIQPRPCGKILQQLVKPLAGEKSVRATRAEQITFRMGAPRRLGQEFGTDIQIGSDGRLTSLRTVPPSPCAGAAGVATDGNSRFVFVADGTSAVCTYAINPSNGDLLLITTAAVTAGTSPVFAAVSPDNAHLYVTNLGSKNVSVYTINADGSLSPVSGSPFSAGNSPSSVSVDPSGKFAYVTNFGDGTISTYTIGSNGALTSAGVTAAGVGPNEIVITQ